jgi:hypothetical protein
MATVVVRYAKFGYKSHFETVISIGKETILSMM